MYWQIYFSNIWNGFKIFLFHFFAYIIINIGFIVAIAIISRLNHVDYETGDGGMAFLIAMVVQFWQIVAGFILSVIFSILELRLKILKFWLISS